MPTQFNMRGAQGKVCCGWPFAAESTDLCGVTLSASRAEQDETFDFASICSVVFRAFRGFRGYHCRANLPKLARRLFLDR